MKLCWLLATFQSDAASAHWRPLLVSDKHVPACRFQLVSPGTGALVWFSCSQGWKWMVDITVMSCCSNSSCHRHYLSSCWRLLLSSASRVRKSTELLWHKTPGFTPDVWSPNRPDLNSVDYRLLRVIQKCVCQKQQGMSLSNIVDELWLLTEWYLINRMTYYISQGRVKAPIRIGRQLCYSSVANLLQYLFAKKIIKI